MIIIQIICAAIVLFILFKILKFVFGILAAIIGGISSAFKKTEPPQTPAEPQRSYSSEEIDLRSRIRRIDRMIEDLDPSDPADFNRWRELNEERNSLRAKLWEMYR